MDDFDFARVREIRRLERRLWFWTYLGNPLVLIGAFLLLGAGYLAAIYSTEQPTRMRDLLLIVSLLACGALASLGPSAILRRKSLLQWQIRELREGHEQLLAQKPGRRGRRRSQRQRR